MNEPVRVHRERPPEPAEPVRGGPAQPAESQQIQAGRREAAAARDLLSQIDALLGTFSMRDLVNEGGE
jgi:hypothetical protein